VNRRPTNVAPVRVLVVYVHPCEESLGAAVRGQVLHGLQRAGHLVREVDLYASEYRPNDPVPLDHLALVDWAESLVLVHPTWWSGHPALLLGWLVGVAERGLPNVRRLVSVTTHGGRRLANVIAGESGRHVVGRALRRRCAPGATFRWCALYGLDRDRESDRTKFLARVEREIGRLVS
jgi:NAD(P)H dehydrogenase (quinone)